MSAMGGMPMSGGWTMSMAWMRMPGQSWPVTAVSFLGMWIVMMVAMMLPSLVPMLWRYCEAVGMKGETRLGRLTALVGVGYFLVWVDLPGTLVFQRRSFTIPNIQISQSRFARYARRTRTRNWTSQLTPTRVTRPKMLRSFGSKNGFGVLSTKYALCRKRTNFCMAS